VTLGKIAQKIKGTLKKVPVIIKKALKMRSAQTPFGARAIMKKFIYLLLLCLEGFIPSTFITITVKYEFFMNKK